MSQLAHLPGAQTSIASAVLGFPFRTEFSLGPLIRYWEREIAEGASVFAAAARSVLEQVRQAPELTGPVVDPAALTAHADLLHALMTAVFAPTFQGEEHAAALSPVPMARSSSAWTRTSRSCCRSASSMRTR